jgi:hypothetical protein
MLIRLVVCLTLALSCLAGTAIVPAPAGAVGLAVAYKPPANGWGYDIEPCYTSANTLVDKNGNPVVKGLGIQEYGAILDLRANVGDFQYQASIPYARVTTEKPKGEDSGLGDIKLYGSYYLPVKIVNIMPAGPWTTAG